ncbi:MAG: aminoglycoside 6-adenylyltransferase [Micrococcales bacterium]|nr:aminoglycoside 6-adenylyltransferase [Micrococcales bacterium]
MANSYADLRRQLDALAQENDQIEALVMVGSRAIGEADQAADLDAVVVSSQADELLNSLRWLVPLGQIWAYSLDKVMGTVPMLSLLFDDAMALDLVIVPPAALEAGEQAEALGQILGRGHAVVKDSLGLDQKLAKMASEKTDRPHQKEFSNAVAQFWIDAVRAAKWLDRGELWTANQVIECRLKSLLIRMAAWRAKATHGPAYDTYWDGRRLEEWAGQRTLEDLASCPPGSDPDSLRQALFNTMDVFRLAAVETASRFGLDYPEAADRKATVWARTWP